MLIESLTYNQSIAKIFNELMELDPNVVIWGPGANDPKSVFDTTKNIVTKFSKERSFDGPISEAGYTGHALGLSLNGIRPIIHYQRIDFALMAWDQIVNNISKWSTMFGKDIETPVILRAIIGRGWGQGQQHSQNLTRMLTSFPGLDIILPTTPQQIYSAYQHAYKGRRPTFILEHRWLQSLSGQVDTEREFRPTTTYTSGEDITLLSYSYGVIECLRAQKILGKAGIKARVIGVNIFDEKSYERIQDLFGNPKFGIVFDLAWQKASPLRDYLQLRESPKLKYISLPDKYTPTSINQVESYYPTYKEILQKVEDFFGPLSLELKSSFHFPDQPIIDDILMEYKQ